MDLYVNVPIAAVSLLLAARLLNSTEGRADAGRLDWVGVMLLCPGLAGIVFGLAETETSGGLSSPSAWGPVAVGAVLITLFVRHALRSRRPLIDNLRCSRSPTRQSDSSPRRSDQRSG
jgi:hypothetical protein